MAGYNEIIGRAEVSDALLPDQISLDVIQTTTQESTVMKRARKAPMSAKKTKQPVLASLPDAYWVDGDTGLKQTSDVSWKGVTMTAEELAVIVPIPNAVVDDAGIPLWDAVKPLLAEAIGKKIDQAALFGTDKPASWPDGIVPAAIAASNSYTLQAGDDIGVKIAEVAEKVSVDGFAVTGFATRPGLTWRLRQARDKNGQPVFTDVSSGKAPALYGYTLDEVLNGSWNAGAAELLMADWTKFVVGVRQDITYDLFTEGVISDTNGKVILNLMQQDSKAMRVVMRVGFAVANPLTRLNATESTRYPAGVLVPQG